MKVKLTGVGWSKFNGKIGAVKFVNGVSEEMTVREADAVCAAMRAEVIEGDEQKMKTRAYDANKGTSAPVAKKSEVVELGTVAQKPVTSTMKYTVEMLGEIADEKGIVGLRDIGSEFGVKDVSVNGLIKKIMEAQKG